MKYDFPSELTVICESPQQPGIGATQVFLTVRGKGTQSLSGAQGLLAVDSWLAFEGLH